MAGFLKKLSEALIGGDAAEQAGYQSGLRERSAADTAFSNAERAREQARRERTERIMADRQLEREQRLSSQFAQPGYDFEDPSAYGDLILGGYGSDYAGVGQGRLRGQEHRFREGIADPTLADELRTAQMEALEPSTALVSRRETGPRAAPSGYRWTDAGELEAITGGPADKQSASGGMKASDSNAIYRQSSGLFGGSFNPLTGEFSGLSRDQAEQAQRIASRASQIYATAGVDHATAVDIALQEMRAGGIEPPSLGQAFSGGDGTGTGAVDEYEGITATGPNGEKIVWRGGQWVPLD